MLVEEELATETPTKIGWKSTYENNEKKVGGSSNKEVHMINCYKKYTPIWTTYAQALLWLLAKGKIDLPKIKP